MTINPAYSPCDPALGCNDTAVKASDFRQPGFQLLDQQVVAFGLFWRNKRVELTELGPGDWDHFSRGIEFHGA